MQTHTSGEFDVKMTPQSSGDEMVSRLLIEKHFHGDLDATSRGEMLAAGTDVKGSAAYVAIEKVTGSLLGKAGTFVLQHTGVMTRGEGKLIVTVVPDSGTGELVGLQGSMDIIIAAGKHSYAFDYSIVGND